MGGKKKNIQNLIFLISMNQNIPNPIENILMSEGLNKIELQNDLKWPNSNYFVLRCEDHTIGNLIRSKLLSDNHVIFAGYKVIHPLKYELLLRIRTDSAQINSSDPKKYYSWTPTKALINSIEILEKELITLQKIFFEEFHIIDINL